ncbi:hypothetical protein ACIBKX_22885 [Streptomyces sp. NPDC050658]|uniref:hypothetical protein n=1 Tax=unclassified Streptomyces TaxID=2593676 RepID=UPI00342DCD11
MINRLIFNVLGNPKLIDFVLRCWMAVVDGLARPAVRIAGGVAAAGAGACAVAYFFTFRAMTGETRHAVETSDKVTGDPGNVLDLLQLLSVGWLVSGVALIALGLLVAVARSGSIVLIVAGALFWTPLGFVGLNVPTPSALHWLSGAFLALVVPAVVLCPAERFAGGRQRRRTEKEEGEERETAAGHG